MRAIFLRRPYGTQQRIDPTAFPTLKRGANDRCASGAFLFAQGGPGTGWLKPWFLAGALAAGLALGTGTARAESGGEPHFQVEYSNPGLVPSQWTLEIRPDGSGHFKSERGQAQGPGIEAPDVDRDIQLNPHFASHVFDVAVRKKLFRDGCESHMKVAFQGTKRLTYSGPAGQGSCEFNYSKDAEIQGLSDSLISVATTLITGARLQALLLHDRLGLDKEMEVLQDSVADGRAQQIGSIRDILERLADDPAVLDRVKRRARILLAKANSGG